MSPVRIVSSYLLIQAAATAAWWCLLVLWPRFATLFLPSAWPEDALFVFGLADVLLIVGGSLVAAFLVANRNHHAGTAVWMLTAAVWYPTLYCLGVSFTTGQAWVSTAMMSCMAGLMLAMATVYGNAGQKPATFRVAPMERPQALGWTLFQVVIFWTVFLLVLPMAICEVERKLQFPRFTFPLQEPAALATFAVFSALGLWSAWTMATRGDGTPLPTATAAKLVVAGPYRYLRNPMALAGIAQGLSVGVLVGSPSVVAYAAAGIPLWHLLVRPFEEADLARRFGYQYHRYRQSVGLWIPLRPSATSKQTSDSMLMRPN